MGGFISTKSEGVAGLSKSLPIIYNNSKKMKKNSSRGNSSILDDDFVMCEILVRLPVKTLMRFKSVCKRWRSSIQHDPEFHQLHYNHSETCLPLRQFTVSAEVGSGYRKITGYQVSDADLVNGVAYHTFQSCDILFSVHGLVCLVDLSGRYVRIYNPSTREEAQYIDSPARYGGDRIVFGFDPVTKKHKVLCRESKSAASEILTVGENSWRRIDHDPQVPNDNTHHGPCVYLNGAIYWMEMIPRKKGQKKKKRDCGAAEVLVAFDVGSEKFRVIPIPDYIINQPRDEYYCRGRPFTDDLLEVNGRVALLRRKNKATVSMWMLFNDDGHHQNWNWSEVIMTLPFEWVGKYTTVRFDNIPGTDQIIMKPCIRYRITAYSHNWKKNTCEKLDYTSAVYFGDPSQGRSKIQSRRTHFRESLFQVN